MSSGRVKRLQCKATPDEGDDAMPNTADHRTPAQDGRTAQADQAVQKYIDAITPEHRPLFDRLHRLILEAQPGATVVLSYQIPTYKRSGKAVLYFAGWKQHYSLYPAGARLVAAFKKELAPYTINKSTIRFPLNEPVPVQLIERIAKFRASEQT